ncbi:MAG: site-specific DNA-methyltransferase [Chloroflexota bacterium]|nr:site-specific DNA-methyltransferase [Chloroflexota bacterium]
MADNGVELVWEGKRREVERVPLPFQRVEIINESRATRQAGPLMRTGPQLPPDPLFGNAAGETPWRNKLIWGDNKYVLSSLIEGDPSIGLEPLAGKVDLIYIDPPFAKGEDFAFTARVGDADISKDQSVIEEIAYRDTLDIPTYLQMMYERLVLMKDLLRARGSIFVHVGVGVAHSVRSVLDELFPDWFQNEVVWQRHDPHNDAVKRFGVIHDNIYWFSKGGDPTYYPNEVREDLSDAGEREFSLVELPDGRVVNYRGQELIEGRRFKLDDATWKGSNPKKKFTWRGATPSPKREWIYDLDGMEAALARGELYLRDPIKGAARCRKRYLDENKGILLQDIWTNAGRMKGGSEYPTQKPELLLELVVRCVTQPGELVLDAFAGSGTTMVAAERLNRRWIGSDLGRFGVHLTRKRLLDIEGCKPFEVLNVGRYERKYWQGINAGEAVYEYFQFIVKLYHAEPVVGFTHLHGRKGEAMVHVGATDAPVTIAEVRAAMEECKANGLTALDVLGWEWEMGLNNTGLLELQQQTGVAARLFHIPHEVMDKRAVAAGDVHFYEAAYVAAKTAVEQGRAVRVELTDFLVAIDDYIREKVGDKVKKWSDWIDYWAVDFEYNGDVFHNQWQAYRTRKEPKLELTSGAHTYTTAGKRQILVKVVDIFGNDTTALLEVQV